MRKDIVVFILIPYMTKDKWESVSVYSSAMFIHDKRLDPASSRDGVLL